MIAHASSWRYVGIIVGLWNFIGLLLVVFLYKNAPKATSIRRKMDILREIDSIGGLLSTAGVLCFMMGMQWGAQQVSRLHGHTLGCLTIL